MVSGKHCGRRFSVVATALLLAFASHAYAHAQAPKPAQIDLTSAMQIDPSTDAPVKPRDVFVYFITEGKVRAPFGAMALMKRVTG